MKCNIIYFNKKDNTKVSKSFKASEFDCKCKENHKTGVCIELVELLEDLKVKLNAKYCVIISGNRCKTQNSKIGGSKTSPHITNIGVDVVFKDYNKNKILSKDVCLALEDMNHQFGVGYRSGNDEYETHIDLKNRGYKYKFDEGFKPYKTIKSFRKYFGIKEEFTPGTYKAEANMYVREKPSMISRIKKVKELNSIIQKALTSTNKNALAVVAKGHTFTATEIIIESNGRVWIKNLNNGYICLKGKDGKKYFSKVK